VNSGAHERPALITELAREFGSQAVVGSLDVKKSLLGRYQVFSEGGRKNTKKDPVEWAVELERLGAGELLVTSIDREGTWSGFDLALIQAITSRVSIPVIAQGGAGTVVHIGQAVKEGKAAAAGVGSMVVFQG